MVESVGGEGWREMRASERRMDFVQQCGRGEVGAILRGRKWGRERGKVFGWNAPANGRRGARCAMAFVCVGGPADGVGSLLLQ